LSPVPYIPSVVKAWARVTVEPADAVKEDDLFRSGWIVREDMTARLCAVEVNAEKHCDEAGRFLHSGEGALDKFEGFDVGRVRDDGVDAPVSQLRRKCGIKKVGCGAIGARLYVESEDLGVRQ
jgi:hypothetical protein